MHNYASGFLIFNYEYSLVPTGLCRKCTVFHLLIRRLTHPLLCTHVRIFTDTIVTFMLILVKSFKCINTKYN